MLEDLKKVVYEANMQLPKNGLVTFTWGNVSGIDREKGLIAIKPSGVEYERLTPEDMVIVDLQGNKVEGKYKPSTDTMTHVVLYNNFPHIGGVVHTHSQWATIFAQTGSDIIPYGTTHGDYFYGAIPCTRQMTKEEVDNDYEANTGLVIVETFKNKNPLDTPGVLVRNHGPFSWGKDPMEAVYHATVMELVAMMAYHTEVFEYVKNSPINKANPLPDILMEKHYKRKHGPDAYYGQIY